MKNKNLVIGTLAISILSISSFASADFDCSTVNREEIKTLMDKQKLGEDLTTEEQTLLENSKNCKPERTGSGELSGSGSFSGKRFNNMSGSGVTQENKEQFEEIRTLIEKKKNGETLTTDEETKISEYEAKKQNFGSGMIENKNTQKELKNSKTKSESNINSLYKTKIDNKIDLLISNSSLDLNSKLEILEKFLKTLEKVQTNLSNATTLTDEKKSTYNELIEYFIYGVNTKISKLNDESVSDENIDEIINQVFGE